MKNKIKVTIAIPAYNNQDTISEAIKSAYYQDYPEDLREILVIDDCSTDNTYNRIQEYACRHIRNKKNLGIGKNLEKLMTEARGRYIIYLCADDLFTNSQVVSDIVNIFDKNPHIGIISRYFYFFLHGHKGAIGTSRDRNILTNSCCPSGMAFRVDKDIVGTNKIFIEMPSIVAQYLKKGWEWTMIEYDTVAARFKPGENTGTKTSYYTESPLQNWIDLLGSPIRFNEGFIQLKNRAPHLLWTEIFLSVKSDKSILLDPSFWFYASIAVIFPRSFLKRLTVWYRPNIARNKAEIIERGN